MGVINHEKKFIFFCEPHTASRASREAVLTQIPGSISLRPHHIRPDRVQQDISEYMWIAGVRNPFDTLITKYQRPSMRNLPFDGYIDCYWHHRDLEPSYQYCLKSHRIIWYEHLLEDLQRVFKAPDLTIGYNPNHKSETKKPWHTYYNEETFGRIAKRADWKEYMTCFGYDVRLDGTTTIDSEIRERYTRPILGR